ncbi:glycosyltransferase family 2 protein [Nodularia spumigena]|uniref:glycosyltransferase family 2 protein n=2 Tax=Nodularia spumigena TaxID=70799 RepID=UPI00232BB312|nr:glycosyltransferase [Nodularia spumigena]MDB9320202.1 glycosyltransferase [Nodularia spumigena CS-590/01A]MDB9324499.1 glycosyltransferase [Nodularia spumigena CS-591/07A]MDB9329189.1 glycosyltransferase [Nodularia spumigena CS-591/04]MDB9336745.1 glycosyltransferase [Nodularia spumigena CS-590/01]MDB9344383.1 glycosyltransferase [Nodularia spumigena CS-588/06]
MHSSSLLEAQVNQSQTIFISIIICTANRRISLERTLIALNKITYSFCEVIVVDASSNTETMEMLSIMSSSFNRDLKLATVQEKNISVSRNVGIKLALGEIIAFIDDDAIPPPDWIEKLLSTYSLYGDKCAGVGGTVRDMTSPGYPLQYHRGITNVISNTSPICRSGVINYNQPQGFWYNGLMGTNSSYRKDLLEKINGYDEFFEYFLDETDVCLRLIQAGYEIHHCDVVVDHYPEASHNRLDQKHLTCWYSLAKNTTYFALKHAFNKVPFPVLVIRLTLLLIYRCFLRIIRLKFTHNLSYQVLGKYIQESIKGMRVGWNRGICLHKFTSSRH